MKSEVKLVKPSIEYKDSYLAFYNEWIESGEDIVPWVVERNPTNFEDMLLWLSESEVEDNLPENYVPHSTYWLINEEKKVVAAVNIRHRLNERLRIAGGHIGYGVCPSQRRKGYATRLLNLALQKTKELSIEEVLVCCDKENIASERTIINNGGKFKNEIVEPNGNVVRRFWIKS
ncbi:GNAT family N-acetyltransferase [Lottiidibacillus patelloidae]|uniref:GNAT family N-acetyltransferase n=1 Tax=Lottiidibacillus patelloidae TaxID=2670334 RepID=A0A263BUZ9_9BACI|nr:GNAT family N-acetyltransferase [Lottiidibacillus patelloidae]OZM57554.1 GNAT family N-acetyltransferase [Lottiidibacillus patelloidae]